MAVFEQMAQWKDEFQQGWLAHVREKGEVDWKKYRHPKNHTAPRGKGVQLKNSRLMLVTSAGAFLKGRHTPFDTADLEGDYSFRFFPPTTPAAELDYAHGHYDEAMIRQDMQVGIPHQHLQTLVETGRLGSLTPSTVSFMGYQPDSARVTTELAPRILRLAQQQGTTAALFAPL